MKKQNHKSDFQKEIEKDAKRIKEFYDKKGSPSGEINIMMSSGGENLIR